MSTTARTPRFISQQATARRVAAGLAIVLTLGLLAGLDQVADRQYDDALMAQAADAAPAQVVVVTAKRLPRA
ncbi:hypothetical protein [Ideonella sp.]|uniref:hypothetical protein n=1 Tax=Ideonella sp. TaxID=1929293 RepID=UPI002B46DB58|nr:hypothetical protein [Ideonella sp.]HJV71276.1 hypothetical protein [Ideonella sp.]